MTTHVFDQAIALATQADGSFTGHTSPAYANMVGPYGGIMAAQVLNAVMQHPARLGEPVSFTVNFAAALADGAFAVTARPARTNRSTQHWVVELQQEGQAVVTATAVTALRRETFSLNETPMPVVAGPTSLSSTTRHAPLEWVKRYDMRFLAGPMPHDWDGSDSGSSHSLLWMRDAEPRPLDYCSLTALADVFFPRIYVRRRQRVPIGTVTMTVYFHADSSQLHNTGTGYVLGQARAQAFRNGFFDQTAQLWNEAGELLVTSHQLVYFKQ
jgi:acyl-CoA thioesterase